MGLGFAAPVIKQTLLLKLIINAGYRTPNFLSRSYPQPGGAGTKRENSKYDFSEMAANALQCKPCGRGSKYPARFAQNFAGKGLTRKTHI
jgi:hypothetical protein